MAEPTEEDLRARFGISSQISSGRVEMALSSALRDVKRKIGVEAYNEVFSGAASTILDSAFLDDNATTTDEDALREGDVTDAVYWYAAAKIVLNTSLHIRPTGIVKREQDAGSPAMGSSSQIINEFLTPKEVQELIASMTSEGDRLISSYIIEQEPEDYGSSSVQVVRA